ncbi:cupin domain-containing protein [Phenylobacterium sp. LjRoot219]|uniref:cupin domain-containing protein n=1 Tax=Phenylobacterium sp. LjRoot219 TaxID=3342283 RepID=UPI003ECD715F
MKLRVHQPADLAWRRIGDIVTGEMAQALDPGELASHVAFHAPGDAAAPQLMELKLEPDALLVPHSHDTSEIIYVVAGELRWGDQVLGQGGSIFIPAQVVYSFRAGPAGARLVNFRPTADHSFHPA